MKFKLYTTKTCAYCPQVKKLLGAKNKEFETIDVTDSYEQRLELQQKYNAMTVPVLVREDGEYMVGLNMQKFFSLV
jgi:glutaredoxin